MNPFHITMTTHIPYRKQPKSGVPLSRILPWLMVKLTGAPRYRPDFKWASNSWTINLFRVYEMIFWRRYGIRHEMSAFHDSKSKKTWYAPHSFEAHISLLEWRIREFFKSFTFKPFKIYVPVLVTPQGIPIFASPYLFAIALDTSSVGQDASSGSFSYTVTGSNPLIMAGINCDFAVAYTSPTMTYNSVSLNRLIGQDTFSASHYGQTIHGLAGPSTGSNTFAYNANASDAMRAGLASYSGVKQTGLPDSSNQGSAASTTTGSVSTTVVNSNCWLFFNLYINSTTPAVSAGGVKRQNQASRNDCLFGDSNGTVGTGSQSVSFTWNSGNGYMQSVSIAPVVTDISISVSDQLNITENISLLLQSFINVFDQLNVSENISRLSVLNISVSDQLTVTDTATVEAGTFNISVFDQLTMTEAVTILIPFFVIDVSDQLNITESVSVALAIDISVFDSMTVSDSFASVTEMNISVSDQLNITENRTFDIDVNISVFDQLTISESRTLLPSDKVQGFIILRGRDQALPITFTEQEYPLGMRDQAEN